MKTIDYFTVPKLINQQSFTDDELEKIVNVLSNVVIFLDRMNEKSVLSYYRNMRDSFLKMKIYRKQKE